MAISAEELEYLLRPSQDNEQAEAAQTQIEEDTTAEGANPDQDGPHTPEKWVLEYGNSEKRTNFAWI